MPTLLIGAVATTSSSNPFAASPRTEARREATQSRRCCDASWFRNVSAEPETDNELRLAYYRSSSSWNFVQRKFALLQS